MDKIREKIKKIWYKEYQLKQLFVVFLLFLVFLGVSAYSISEYKINNMYREKQAACEHDYRELYSYEGGGFEIYCPKCQLQDYVSTKDWNRIQIDMEYNKVK